MQKEVLLAVKRILKARGKHLKSLVIFGSSIYNPARARDLDILIIIDELKDFTEKCTLEVEIAKVFRKAFPKMLVDIIIFDEDSFRENLEPGGLPSGLVAGYKIIHDELGLEDLIGDLAKKIARSDYIVQKGRRRINISALARIRFKLLDARFEEMREQNRSNHD